MTPKIDFNATPRARIIDALLCLFILVVLAILILTSPTRHTARPSRNATGSIVSAR